MAPLDVFINIFGKIVFVYLFYWSDMSYALKSAKEKANKIKRKD